MPRLPVDGNKVIEHRITLGTYEREQLNRFVDGMQVRNIGQGFGAATDPLEALFNTTTGTVGGAFFVAWALKRFFNIDVPVPTDAEDLTEVWSAINSALFLTPQEREEVNRIVTAEKTELKEKAGIFGVKVINVTRRIHQTVADILFGSKDSIVYSPEEYEEPPTYEDVPVDPGSKPTPEEYRRAVAARWFEGTYPFSYARDLLVGSGMTEAGAAEYLNNYEKEMSGSL